jgi:hypothetical protein
MAINTSFKRKTGLNIIEWSDCITNLKSLKKQVGFIPQEIPTENAQTYVG